MQQKAHETVLMPPLSSRESQHPHIAQFNHFRSQSLSTTSADESSTSSLYNKWIQKVKGIEEDSDEAIEMHDAYEESGSNDDCEWSPKVWSDGVSTPLSEWSPRLHPEWYYPYNLPYSRHFYGVIAPPNLLERTFYRTTLDIFSFTMKGVWTVILGMLDLIGEIILFLLRLIYLPPFLIFKFIFLLIRASWNEAIQMLRDELRFQQSALMRIFGIIYGIFRVGTSIIWLVVTFTEYIAMLLLGIAIYPLQRLWLGVVKTFRSFAGVVWAGLVLLGYCVVLAFLVMALVRGRQMRNDKMVEDDRWLRWLDGSIELGEFGQW